MKSHFTNTRIGYGGLSSASSLYYAFSNEKVITLRCKRHCLQTDLYWNKTATIPSQFSVLLDTQTPHKYTEHLFNAIDGENKELVTLDYAPHTTLKMTPMVARANLGSDSCRFKIFTSCIRIG
ncbi:Serine protease [Phytophthora megakarya]|uniref:Serine protease n=1 Tax=Phytophthora megakarya TaxID=4795 RepID=A0A225UUE0_9STRA|nr:Serine protease [Phytophthora megakarya]